MDRVAIIMNELSGCRDAQSKGGDVTMVYLSTESIGVIATQAMAMRSKIAELQTHIDRLETKEEAQHG